MKKNLLVMFLLFSACSTVDEDAFYSKTIGTYTLNDTGADFIWRRMNKEIESGTTLQFRGNATDGGVFEVLNGDTIATLVSVEKQYQALFKLEGVDTYVAMGLNDSKWISTTNAETDSSKVLFEHLIPIATKD